MRCHRRQVARAATRRPGGLVTATERHDDLLVSVLLAVNAVGGSTTAPEPVAPRFLAGHGTFTGGNTTIGLIVTNADLDKAGCHLLAQGGHDGLARALLPPHTRSDGDALVGAATGPVVADVDLVRWLVVVAVERAVKGLRP